MWRNDTAPNAPPTILERFFLRDRLIVVVSLLALTMAAWFYLFVLSLDMAVGDRSLMGMPPMSGALFMQPPVWTFATFMLMFAMWWIMMIGMMVPGAAPTILLFARIERKNTTERDPGTRCGFFTLGYVAVWLGFSLIATVLQWGLATAALFSGTMATTGTILNAAIVAAAGLYQLTGLKKSCLDHCRSPIQYLSTNWRTGNGGAFRMGTGHGVYCVGCCWALMALLFIGGVMNLYWVAGLAIFVLLEKVVPHGVWISRGSGLAMLGFSTVLFLQAV